MTNIVVESVIIVIKNENVEKRKKKVDKNIEKRKESVRKEKIVFIN